MRNRFSGSSELTGRQTKLHAPPNSSTAEADRTEQQICLFGPERYEPRYQYPLIVWLHSCNSTERELESVMPALSLQNYVACAPRGTVAADPNGRLFGWGSSAASAAIAEELVFDAMHFANSQFSIANDRIFLAGFGSGGTMAWRIAMRYPQHFMGAVSVCGKFPDHHEPLSNLMLARELPSLWMYGGQSKDCGVQKVCDTLPILHSASLSVDIRQYPCQDELLTNMLYDMNAWLMERVTRQPAQSRNEHAESFSRN